MKDQNTQNSTHQIAICVSDSCRKNFSLDTLKAAEKTLGISAGEATPDNQFSLFMYGCLGNCSDGPSAMIDNKLYGKIFPREIKEKINELKQK